MELHRKAVRSLARRATALACGGVPLLARSQPSLAAPDPPTCETVTVSGGDTLPPEWRVSVEALRERVRALPPSECPHIVISVAAVGGTIIVSASTPDGRSAARPAHAPEALWAITMGLVAQIPPETLAHDGVPAAATTPPEAVPDAAPAPPRPPSSPDVAVRAVAGAGAGARLAFPTSVALMEVEGFVTFDANAWAFAANVRYVPGGAQMTGLVLQYSYQEVALGLGFGRHMNRGIFGADLTVGPSLVFATERSGALSDSDYGFKALVRLDGAVRGSIRLSSRWSAVTVFDAELDPFNAASPVRFDPELPAMPTWTLGLRAGVSGDLL